MGMKKGPHSHTAPAGQYSDASMMVSKRTVCPGIARVSGSVFETGVDKLKMAAA
jgi:hypothetical protein